MSSSGGIRSKQAKLDPAARGGFVNAMRVHKAITADFEKRLLIWIARRMPAWVKPDHLTGLAFVAQLMAGAAYAVAMYDRRSLWLVDLLVAFNWFGDSLDGTLARVRNRQRPRYGFYVDHIADTFGALVMMVGLACSGYVHWQMAAGLLAGFYILSIESYLATYATGHFHLSHGIFGPTEIRILLATGNAIIFWHPFVHVAGGSVLLFDAAGAVAISTMLLMALVAALRHTGALYREETIE